MGGSWSFIPTVSFSTADIVSWGIQRRMVVVDGVWGLSDPYTIILICHNVPHLFFFPISSSFPFLPSFFLLSLFLPSILLPYLYSSINTALNPRTRYPTLPTSRNSHLSTLLPQHRLEPQNLIPYPTLPTSRNPHTLPYLTFVRARARVPYLEPLLLLLLLLLFNVEVKLGVP